MNQMCPYCNVDIEPADPDKTECPTCGAAHHTDCWQENGGCTVFGCAAAPGEGPTITVEASDLAAAPPPAPNTLPGAGPALSFGGYIAPDGAAVPHYTVDPKNRTTFILLGLFLGCFGAHNFYAGYKTRGFVQLGISVCTLFIGALVPWIWACVEVCVVDRDSRGIYMV